MPSGKSKRVQTVLSEKQYEALRRISETEGSELSEVLRVAFVAYAKSSGYLVNK